MPTVSTARIEGVSQEVQRHPGAVSGSASGTSDALGNDCREPVSRRAVPALLDPLADPLVHLGLDPAHCAAT